MSARWKTAEDVYNDGGCGGKEVALPIDPTVEGGSGDPYIVQVHEVVKASEDTYTLILSEDASLPVAADQPLVEHQGYENDTSAITVENPGSSN